LTLRINTSRCERTRSHFLNSNRAAERQYRVEAIIPFTIRLPRAPAMRRLGSSPHFDRVCAGRITSV
jgi:hypothetical protein